MVHDGLFKFLCEASLSRISRKDCSAFSILSAVAAKAWRSWEAFRGRADSDSASCKASAGNGESGAATYQYDEGKRVCVQVLVPIGSMRGHRQ